jgi:thioredoxin-related protein
MSDLPDNPEGNVDAEKLLAVTKYISDIKYEKLLNDIGVDDEDPEVS